MEKKLLLAGVIATGLFTSVASFANTSSNCIPSIVSEGNKYQISHSGKTERVKVMKIDAGSCWVKVKAVNNNANDPVMAGAVDTRPYWVNFNNVSSVR